MPKGKGYDLEAARSKPQRMAGQQARSEGTYRFTGSTAKGTARMDPVDAKVSRDINARDRADIRAAEDKARAHIANPKKNPAPSKMDKMAYKDATERQNRLGAAYGSVNRADTGKGYTLAEGRATGDRLKKRYGVKK